MFLPSSMIGVRQYAQLTLQGSLCTVVFSELSYQPRSWTPLVKLMSSLWNMAAHWKGAPENMLEGEADDADAAVTTELTMNLLTCRTMAIL